jgi:Flp pilus assembly protein TadD
VRQQRRADGLKALGEAVRLAPGDSRFAYVYAVALNDASRPKDAVKTLKDALQRQPYDRDVLFGLAHFSVAAGERDAALRYARLLTELDPENREYQRLAAGLAAPAR